MSSDSIGASREARAPVEQAPVVMPSVQKSRHHWAVVLAGGDGTRLQSLTLKIAGDSRPKQFCSIFGGESLLTQTRARVDSRFLCDRFALALLHVLQRDPNAVVVFVPCDHYYSDAEASGRAIRSAISGAEQYPDSIVVLGAEADYAEVEYGWIELGSAISNEPFPLLRVNRFWEKPSLPQARALLRRSCLWNTFVTVGYASTFLDLLCSQVPSVVLSINKAMAENELDAAYRLMP
jgi:mannose-1-phosphate guanylyltransferase